MKIDIITIFPDMFSGPFTDSMLKRAQDKKIVDIKIHNLRNWATDKHKTVDDRPYGGGKGMVLKIDVIDKALSSLKKKNSKVILLSPQGEKYKQSLVQKFSKFDHLILLCGHYEGFDERVRQLIDFEISIGDYVLTGGEIPAMVLVDSIIRLLPGVLDPEASSKESFSDGKSLDFPQYTRPEKYKNMKVSEILLSGNHKKIDEWRKKKSLEKTKKLKKA